MLESSGLTGWRYTIYDMLGKEVIARIISSDQEHVDLTTAAAGVYNLQIQSGSDIRRIRLIIE
jgi:hypothetical protein